MMGDDRYGHEVPTASCLGVIRTVFQPVVALETRDVLGWEALTRGDARLGLEAPDHLFAAAADVGLTVDLDWACQAEAFRSALEAGLPAGTFLFINVEPETAVKAFPPQLGQLANDATTHFQVVFEITERSLGRYGKRVLVGARRARAAGAKIAIDDLGAEPAAVELLPLLQPDIIKLDRRLIQQPDDPDIDHIITTAVDYARRSGTTILAEGIETEHHHLRALAIGATCGQGWLHGHPTALPDRPPARSPRTPA